MSRRALLSLTFSILTISCHADAFLKVDDIDGESTVSGYEGWITIDSFSAGLESLISDDTTRTIGRAQPDSMTVEKRLDAASPYLFLATAKQTALDSVVLESRISRGKLGESLVRYEITNARIISLDTASDTTSEIADSPIKESIAFSFEEWAMHYQRPGVEQIAATWNFASGTGGLEGSDAPDVPQIDPLETLVSIPGEVYRVKVNLSDGDTPAEKLTIRAESLNPEKVSILGIDGSGLERSLNLQVSKLFSGSASVNIWVSDGFQSRSRTLQLSIEGGETPYETYLLGAFGEALAENSELASPIGDPDQDGLRTIAEFYLGTNPNEFTKTDDAITVERTLEGDVVKTQLQYYRRTDTDGLTGRILLSSNLEGWTELNAESEPTLIESTKTTEWPYEKVTATLNLPAADWENSFLRLQVDGTF